MSWEIGQDYRRDVWLPPLIIPQLRTLRELFAISLYFYETEKKFLTNI